MFSGNGKISQRQLYRMLVVAMLGPALLVCPRLLGEYGSLGFVAYFIACLMSALYILGSLKLKELVSDKLVNNRLIWNIIKGFFGALAIIRLFVVALGGIYIMYDVIRRILLPKTNGIMILLLVGVLLVYWIQSGLECNARAMELLFYWVLVPIVISFAVAIPNVKVENLLDIGVDFASKSGTSVVDIAKNSLIIKTFIVFIIFTPADVVWLCKDSFNCSKISKPVWKGFTFFWIANVVAYGIILGIYGVKGLNVDENYPLIKVMQISGVPGDFLRRVDGFMGTYLVVSIFCGVVLALTGLRMVIGSLTKRLGKV